MALDPVLARIPGLAGYLAQDEYSRNQETQDAQKLGVTAKLADHFREENFRRGLTPGMGNDEILSRAIRSVGPEKAATLLQGQANLRESADTRKQIALANLSARMMKDREQLDIAGRNASTAERRAQIAEARSKMDAFYRGQAGQIASGKLYDETGIAGVGGGQFDIGSLLTPSSGPVGAPGAAHAVGPWAAKGPMPFEELPPDQQSQVKAWRGQGSVPAPRLEAEMSPPVQPSAASNNLDARDLGAGSRGPVMGSTPIAGAPMLTVAPVQGPIPASQSKELPPEIKGLIDAEPSPRRKRAIEARYRLSQANKDINIAGGRESVYNNRIILAGNEAAADLENVVKLPMTASRGLFGGRGQDTGIFNAGKETLANAMTTQEVQSYNVLATGFQRSLAAIEAAGLAPQGALMHQMDAVIFKEGDTNFTKLLKLAQTRQIVEKGLETMMANPRVPPETKKHVEEIVKSIQTSVPFKATDLLKLRHEQQKNPNITLVDIIGIKKAEKADLKSMSDVDLLKALGGR